MNRPTPYSTVAYTGPGTAFPLPQWHFSATVEASLIQFSRSNCWLFTSLIPSREFPVLVDNSSGSITPNIARILFRDTYTVATCDIVYVRLRNAPRARRRGTLTNDKIEGLYCIPDSQQNPMRQSLSVPPLFHAAFINPVLCSPTCHTFKFHQGLHHPKAGPSSMRSENSEDLPNILGENNLQEMATDFGSGAPKVFLNAFFGYIAPFRSNRPVGVRCGESHPNRWGATSTKTESTNKFSVTVRTLHLNGT